MQIDTIVVPRGAEARAVERGWTGVRPPMLLVPAGEAAARALNDGRPIRSALVLGLCGALDPALRIGEAVVYADIVDGAQTIGLDCELTAACATLLACTPQRSANVAAVVSSSKAKSALRAASGAAVIDMEAAAVARALHARRVRVTMVRVVSDDAASELPDLRNVYDERGSLRPLSLGAALARTPLRSVTFIGNVLTALGALRKTATVLSR